MIKVWPNKNAALALIALIFFVATFPAAAESFKSIYIEEARTQLAALTTNFPDAKVLNSITNLPLEIRERLSDTADAGEPFSSGCVRKYAGHRFLTATRIDGHQNREQLYVVAVEHGGIAYNWSILEFVVNDKGKVIHENNPADEANHDQRGSPGTNQSPPSVGPGG